MKLQKLFCVFVLSVLGLGSSVSFGGNEGKGGDKCQDRIEQIRNDIYDWIQAGVEAQRSGGQVLGSSLLDFSKTSISLNDYNSKMLREIERTKLEGQGTMSCTNNVEEVKVDEAYMTCKAFGPTNDMRFKCFRGIYKDGKPINGFMGSPEDEQYFQVHHELAVMAGLEDQSAQDSDYPFSDQIVGRSGYRGFLVNQIVKKLSIQQLPLGTAKHVEYDCRRHGYESVAYYKFTIDSQILDNTQIIFALSDIQSSFHSVSGPIVESDGSISVNVDYQFNGPWNWDFVFHMGRDVKVKIDNLRAKYPNSISVSCRR